jgi:hypothetical protein
MDAFYERHQISSVMAGLVPAIHVFVAQPIKAWMPAQASLRSLRKLGCERGHDDAVRYRLTSLATSAEGQRP